MQTQDLWKSGFGDEYTKRNGVSTLEARQRVWEMTLPEDCNSVLEVGANTGLNLQSISDFHDCELYATEPNEMAREQLRLQEFIDPRNVKPDTADKLNFADGAVDLVLTSGVLIHIAPDKLAASMKEIHRVAKRWVICAEYFAPHEEMIPYRGHDNALWRRDYGSLYLDAFPDLKCKSVLFLWKRMTGLDNLTLWVFEKGPKAH